MRGEEAKELIVVLIIQSVHTGISPVISKKKLQLPRLFLDAHGICRCPTLLEPRLENLKLLD
jgi:hypothetical protein